MRRGVRSFKQGSGGKEDKEWLDSRKVPQLLDSPDAYFYDKGGFLSSLSPQILQLLLMGHQSPSPLSPQTIHVACPMPQKRMACHFDG